MFARASTPIRIHVFGKSDVGHAREHNEDRFLVADLSRPEASLLPHVREHDVGEHGSLLVVADGMGGAAAGEIASEMAADTIYEHMRKAWSEDKDPTPQLFAFRLREAVETANSKIHSYAKAHAEARGMGTTSTAVGVLGDQLFLTQVGDSRAYLVRRGTAYQLTKDQSLTQRLVEAGELTEEQAAHSDRKNIILQALGPEARVKVDLTFQELRRGDVLVLCSDGLTGPVKNEEIGQIAGGATDLSTACDRLIALANERGGPDNITVIIAQFDGESLRAAEAGDEPSYHVYPLIDTETSTEPVPVYRGSPPPLPAKRARSRALLIFLIAAALAGLGLYFFGPRP